MEGNINVIHLGEYQRTESIETEDKKGWVNYGIDNLYPQFIIDIYKKSPTHKRVVDSLVRTLVGDGIKHSIESQLGKESVGKINHILKSLSFDWELFGGFYIEVIRSLKGEPLQFNYLPFENVRLAITDEDDKLTGVFVSKDWSQVRKEKYKPEFIEIYNPEAKQDRSVLIVQNVSAGSGYYPSPTYEGAISYIELEGKIGEFHINQISNGLFPSFIINWRNGASPNEEEKRAVTRQLERKLSGAENAGKFIQTYSEPGTDTTPEIITFPISDADKQYEFLSRECTAKILIAHGITSPTLVGVRDGGGLGNNANEQSEAQELLMTTLIIPDRRYILGQVEPLTTELGILPDWNLRTQDGSSDEDNEKKVDNYIKLSEKIKDGTITIESARVIAKELMQFTDDEVEQLFPIPLTLSEKKKDRRELTDDEANEILSYLSDKAETIESLEADGWELISDEKAGSVEEESKFELSSINLAYEDYANAEERSEWGDSGLYKLRYAYSQNLSGNSRKFCVDMVGNSKQGLIYRFEDIRNMSDSGVNGQFAPEGQSTYNIFDWKGGVYCHHYWRRLIFFRKRKDGKFLPKSKTDQLENDKRVGNVPFVPQKGAEGIAPINTPTRGSLKNS